MSNLLKGKRVFVDTQVFRQARFAVSNPSFAKLRELCEARKLTLLTTEITRREIDANILEVASDIKQALTKVAGIAPSLDKENIDAMADYFFEHFGIAFGNKEIIVELKEIMVTRNKISHEIYSTPPRTLEQIKDQPLVSDVMLKRARNLFKSIPMRCVGVGVKTYQSHFR